LDCFLDAFGVFQVAFVDVANDVIFFKLRTKLLEQFFIITVDDVNFQGSLVFLEILRNLYRQTSPNPITASHNNNPAVA
jgi:hypothetical protein